MKNLSTSSIFENCCRGDILISSFMVWRSDLYWFLRSAFSYMNKLVKKRGVALEVKKGGRDGNSGERMKSHIFPCFFTRQTFLLHTTKWIYDTICIDFEFVKLEPIFISDSDVCNIFSLTHWLLNIHRLSWLNSWEEAPKWCK